MAQSTPYPAIPYVPASPVSRRAPGAVAPRTPFGVAGAPYAPGTHTPGTLATLLDALGSERRLVDELTATMRRQRAAVAVDDLQAVDDSVFATHRLLATLGQARQRRKAVNRLLCGHEEVPLRLLGEVVGAQMTDALRDACEALQESAESLSREVELNRRVLRDALAHGDQLVHALGGAPADLRAAGYAAPGAAPGMAGPGGGYLVNRTA